MGALNNISIRIISTAFLAGAVLASSSAMAADGAIESASEPVASKSSVSMSPEHVADAGLIEAAPAALLSEAALPAEALTRAASRAKIADMSPMTWLASYGPVVVGRPN
ncbi:MAG: hypothetical protein ACKVIW_09400 [bacterium]|jgi:hypothetical protein